MQRRTDKITIISELSHQHGGDIDALETMMLQSKMGGADLGKVQLISSQDLFGDDRKRYAELSFNEFAHLTDYGKTIGLPLFASVFDIEKLEWCKNLNIDYYKIASRSFENKELVEAAIATGKTVFISTGYNYNETPFQTPYSGKNVFYFYCLPEYPCSLEKFVPHHVLDGYSDHCCGLTAAITAVTEGAIYIEKHFTLSKSLQSESERGHLGSMDLDDLIRLRRFCDEFALLKSYP